MADEKLAAVLQLRNNDDFQEILKNGIQLNLKAKKKKHIFKTFTPTGKHYLLY